MDLVGFTGIMFQGKTARFKNSYIFPIYRRQGLYAASKRRMMHRAIGSGATKLEAICTDMSVGWFLKNGFRVTHKYQKYTKVERLVEDISEAQRF
jgi:hypothetical protein